jgi:hypothetical protein
MNAAFCRKLDDHFGEISVMMVRRKTVPDFG